MSASQDQARSPTELPNGPGAAAILAAGIGCAAVGVLAFAGDASDAIGKALNIYNPTGTLSGVTTFAIIIWLVAWFVLSRMWRGRTVGMAKVNVAAFLLLAVGFLLTFPPFMDLLQGK
jgi:asparagine N-glycosylation enzyme membrane subunit Stt3